LTVYPPNQPPYRISVSAITPDTILTGMLDPSQPGGFVLPLPAAQVLLGVPGEMSFAAVSNPGDVADATAASDDGVKAVDDALAGTAYRAVPVKQRAVDSAEEAGDAFTRMFLIMGLFSIASGVLLIFLIFVLLAAERKPEMGMARAVGMKQWQLTQMFLAEGIAYDLVSALVGSALGVGVAFLIAGVMRQLVGEFVQIQATTS
jgi:putative ABC transport system permease protein